MTALDIFEVRSRRRGLSLVHKCMVGNALSSIRSSLAWHLIQFEPGSWRYPEIKRAGESITRLALHLGMELTDGDKKQLSADRLYQLYFERVLRPMGGSVPLRLQDIGIRCQQALLLAKVAIEEDESPVAPRNNVVSLAAYKKQRGETRRP